MTFNVSASEGRSARPVGDMRSGLREFEESCVVGGSTSSDTTSGSDDAPRPVMKPKAAATATATADMPTPRRARSYSTSYKAIATSPSLVLRTQSVRGGRRASLEVVIIRTEGGRVDPLSIPKEDFRILTEAKSGKRLREERDNAISNESKVFIDLSQRWDNLNPAAGARVAPVRGLLTAAAGKKLTLDLSNYRTGMLREGARIRNETEVASKDWQKALRDIEAGLVVESLAEEIDRLAKAPAAMPELALICRDQALSTTVYPLVKCLASHASTLTRLKQLDLARSSRSDEVCEARPPTDKALARAYDKFAGRIAQLVSECPSLQTMSLRMNGVHAYALAALAHALSRNQGLQWLDLSCNPLTTQPTAMGPSVTGLRALVRALRAGCALQTLDLSFCGLGNREADLLAEALKHNKMLEKINLGGNPIALAHPIFKDRRVVRDLSMKTQV